MHPPNPALIFIIHTALDSIHSPPWLQKILNVAKIGISAEKNPKSYPLHKTSEVISKEVTKVRTLKK